MLKYKVGQNVFDVQIGKGVIVKTDDSIYPYLVRLNNGDIEWCAEIDLIAGDLQAENERLKAALGKIAAALLVDTETETLLDDILLRIEVVRDYSSKWIQQTHEQALAESEAE